MILIYDNNNSLLSNIIFLVIKYIILCYQIYYSLLLNILFLIIKYTKTYSKCILVRIPGIQIGHFILLKTSLRWVYIRTYDYCIAFYLMIFIYFLLDDFYVFFT